ncbi:MAG: hypothetical protein GXP62_05975 [Oligoflexia bacterium]|nr:hypothetical protein [Oligoflexia bacterium]
MEKDIQPQAPTLATAPGASTGGNKVDLAPAVGADTSVDASLAADMQGSFGNSFVAATVGQQSAQATPPPALPTGFDADAKADALFAAMDGWGTDERAVLDVLYSGGTGMNQAVAAAYRRKYTTPLDSALRSELSGDVLKKALLLLKQGKLSLVDKIREGAAGWGTDETRIFQALQRASTSDLAALKADSQTIAILSSELSSDDFRLAMAYVNGQGTLAASMRRSINGLGTDEDAIWTALSGASATEKAFVLAQPALTRDLRRDLSASDWYKCDKLLRGKLDNVDRIEMAMMGWGTDEDALHTAIAALTSDEYSRLPANIDSRIDSELSGSDQILARDALHQKRIEFDADYRNASMAQQSKDLGQDALTSAGASVLLSQGDAAQSAVARLVAACAGLGTDNTTIWQVISGLSGDERAFIIKFNPDGVLDTLNSDLSDSEYQHLLDVLGGSGAASLVKVATAGWGTDESMIYRAIDHAIREGGTAALLADADAMTGLAHDLSAARYRLLLGVLRSGQFTPKQRILWATLGSGTDEDLIWEIAGQYSSDLRAGDGIAPDIDIILKDELSTRDYWKALDMIRGEPRSEADRLARSKELLERERGGVSTVLMDSFSASGERADDAWREYQGTYNTALEDGQVQQDEIKLLRRDEEFSRQTTADYASTKAAVAMWGTQIAVAIVGAAATILTMGAAGPFVAGVAASLGGNLGVMTESIILGAALKVGLNRAIEGEGYDLSSAEALLDGVGASLDVGLNVLGAQVAGRIVQGLAKASVVESVGPSIEAVFGQAGRRILAQGVEGGIDGGLAGIGDGAFRNAAQESSWQGDIEEVFGGFSSAMLLRGAQGGVGGFTAKAAFASIGEVWGARVRAKYGDDPAKYPVPGDGQLDDAGKVIRRQQDDALPGVRGEHQDASTYGYRDYKDGKAFVKGRTHVSDIDPNDVKQGQLGDCYLMAGMAATARAEPEAIRRLIVDNGDGTFEVTLFIRKTPSSTPVAMRQVIDARLPSKGAGNPVYAGLGSSTKEGDELWPALLEKRLAQEKGSYELISGGNIAKGGFNFAGASELLTGKAERYFTTASLSENRVMSLMEDALTAKKPITVDSMSMEKLPDLSREANAVNVYGNHAYAVESVDVSSRTVNLQNPWGSNHVKNLPIKDFMRYYKSVRVGGG